MRSARPEAGVRSGKRSGDPAEDAYMVPASSMECASKDPAVEIADPDAYSGSGDIAVGIRHSEAYAVEAASAVKNTVKYGTARVPAPRDKIYCDIGNWPPDRYIGTYKRKIVGVNGSYRRRVARSENTRHYMHYARAAGRNYWPERVEREAVAIDPVVVDIMRCVSSIRRERREAAAEEEMSLVNDERSADDPSAEPRLEGHRVE